MYSKSKAKKKSRTKKSAVAAVKAPSRIGGSITSVLQQAIDVGKARGAAATAAATAAPSPPVDDATTIPVVAKEASVAPAQEQAPSNESLSLPDPVQHSSVDMPNGTSKESPPTPKSNFETSKAACSTASPGKDLAHANKVLCSDDEPDVASHLYEGAKGAWMWGKSHIPFADVWMGFAESIANSVLEVATGHNLHKVDEKVIKPHLTGLDTTILNPALRAMVDSILESENGKEQSQFHSLLFNILRPPVRLLIKADEEATGETSVEG